MRTSAMIRAMPIGSPNQGTKEMTSQIPFAKSAACIPDAVPKTMAKNATTDAATTAMIT